MKITKKTILSIFIMMIAFMAASFPSRADIGPKPSISLEIKNAPKDYYVGLLVDSEGYMNRIEPDDEPDIKGSKAFEILTGYEEDGWRLFTDNPVTNVYYRSNGDHKYFFTYRVPSVFKVIVVSYDGRVYVSNEIKREKFNAECTYDVESKELKENVLAGAGNYILFAVICYLATIILEGVALLIFGLFNKKNIPCFLIANTITQLFLNAVIIYLHYHGGQLLLIFVVPIAEIFIMIIEGLIFRKRLVNRYGEVSTKKNFVFAIFANVFSIVMGLMLFYVGLAFFA
ncbi:MAG: hypothetical protein K5921_11075 [Lachnospiraceae bacterium]|nr:hypothetical protein [Lachnospiraceae bacterium]